MIRRAGPEDAFVLARLRYDFRVELDPPTEGERDFLERCRRWMTERLTTGNTWQCWLGLEDDEPVGAA